VFLAGAFAGDLRIGDKDLSQPSGAADGVFFARVRGNDGTATSLKRIPPISGARTATPPGQGAHPAGVVADRAAIWLGGNVEDIGAAFVHRLSR
jgi:hypothetical protein